MMSEQELQNLRAKYGITPTAPTMPTSTGKSRFDAYEAPVAPKSRFDALDAQTAEEPAAKPDNRNFLEKFGDAGGKVLGGLSKYSGMEGLVKTLARVPGELTASSYELAGKQAPAWAKRNQLSSPILNETLKKGFTPEAAQAASEAASRGESGAGFTDVLNVASVLPGGRGAGALSGGLVSKTANTLKNTTTIGRGGKVLPLLLDGALTGTKWGGAYGAASAIDSGGSFKDVASGASQGALTGAVLGAGLSLAGSGVSKASTLFDKNAQKNNLIASRQKELSKLENSYASIRTATEKAKDRGFDPKKVIAETDLLNGAVDKDGTIRTTHEGGAVEKVRKFIQPKEKIVSQLLDIEGKTINVKDIEKQLRNNIDGSNLEGEALDAAHAKIDREIKGLLRRADEVGNVPISKIQDAKISKYNNLNYLDPSSKNADKSIARTYKDIVAGNTESADVNALNNELAEQYSVMGILEKLDGKKVAGGRLGKYFAQTTGAIIGSHFGPIGSVVGAEVGSGLKGSLMKNKFRGQTGIKMQDSPAMKAALEKVAQSSNNTGNRMIAQTNTIIPTRTGISSTVAQLPNSVNAKQSTASVAGLLKSKGNKTAAPLLSSRPAVKYGDIPTLTPKLLNKITKEAHSEDYALMNEFVDYTRGKFPEDVALETKVRSMAREMGLNPDSDNKTLANQLNKIVGAREKIDMGIKSNNKLGEVIKKDSLIAEAKKYKSADEFVKAKTDYGGKKKGNSIVQDFIDESRGKNNNFEQRTGIPAELIRVEAAFDGNKLRQDWNVNKWGETGGPTVKEYLSQQWGKTNSNSPQSIISAESKIKLSDLQKIKEKTYGPTYSKEDLAAIKNAESFDEIWNIVRQQGPDTQGMWMTRLTDIWNKANKKTLGEALKKKK